MFRGEGGGHLVCGGAPSADTALPCPPQEACAALLDQCLAYVQARAPRGALEKTPAGGASVRFYPLLRPPPEAAAPGPCLSLVIDGKSLAYALERSLEDKFLFLAKQCRSVLCCRSTPLQKSMVVKLVRSKLKAMTLAIGERGPAGRLSLLLIIPRR